MSAAEITEALRERPPLDWARDAWNELEGLTNHAQRGEDTG